MSLQESARTLRPSSRRSPTAGNRGQGSKWLCKTTRHRIYARDGHRCVWCLSEVATLSRPGAVAVLRMEDVSFEGRTVRLASVDHVVSRAKGGTNSHGNLITSCVTCNAKRIHRSVPAFAAALEDQSSPHMHPELIERRVRAAQRRKLP